MRLLLDRRFNPNLIILIEEKKTFNKITWNIKRLTCWYNISTSPSFADYFTVLALTIFILYVVNVATYSDNILFAYSIQVPDPRPGQCVNDSKTLPDTSLNFIKEHSLMDEAVIMYFKQPVLVSSSTGYAYCAAVYFYLFFF